MTTQTIKLTPDEWVQITTGAEKKLVQVVLGSIEFCDSPGSPAADMAGHIGCPPLIGVTPPTQMWARAMAGGEAELRVS